MNMSRTDIRKLLKYEFQLGHRASEAAKNINFAQGVKTVDESTARRWFSKFRNGDLNLDDKPRPGQPRKINWRSVVNVIELDPTMTTQMLAGAAQFTGNCSKMANPSTLRSTASNWTVFTENSGTAAFPSFSCRITPVPTSRAGRLKN